MNDVPQAAGANGFWLIEPEELSSLAAFPETQPLAETILRWLAGAVSDRLRLDESGISLEVIYAEYLGRYPCLGGRALRGEISDELAEAIESEISRLLTQTPVGQFAGLVASQRLAS